MNRKRTRFASAGRSAGGVAGRSAGATMATQTSAVAGTNLIGASGRGGKLGRAFFSAGRLAGSVFGAASAAIIAGEIEKTLTDKFAGGKRGNEAMGRPGSYGSPFGEKGIFGGLFKRKGGAVGFQGGGLVPSVLSPGELGILPDGGAFTVPGRRVAADNFPAMLPAGTSIFTGSGQAMLAAGMPPDLALSRQAPHFRTGGKVKAGSYNSTSYGPPWGGINGGGVTRTGVNLKGAPKMYGIAVDPNQIALGSKVFVKPNPFNTNKVFTAFDTGGAIKGNRLDFYDWRGRSKQLGWGKRAVQVSTAAGARVGGGGSSGARSTSISIPAASSYPLMGNLFSTLGETSLSSTENVNRTELLTSVLEGIAPETSDYPSRKQISLSGPAALAGRRAGGGGGEAGDTRFAALLSTMSKIDARSYGCVYGGGHAQPREAESRLDCSSSVALAMQNAGIPWPTGTSATTWARQGRQGQVRDGHVDPSHTYMAVRHRGLAGVRHPDRTPAGPRFPLRSGLPVPSRLHRPPPCRVSQGWHRWHPARQAQGPAGAARDPSGGIRRIRKGGKVGRGPRTLAVGRNPLGSTVRRLAGSPGVRWRPDVDEAVREAGPQVQLQQAAQVPGRHPPQACPDAQERPDRAGAHPVPPVAWCADAGGGRARAADQRAPVRVGRHPGVLVGPVGLAVGPADPVRHRPRLRGRPAGPDRGGAVRAWVPLPGSVAAWCRRWRAKQTGNKAKVKQVSDEIKEVDRQSLGLRASIVTLNKSIQEQNESALAEAMQALAEAQKAQTEALNAATAEVKKQNDFATSVTAITSREAVRALSDVISGGIGATYSQRSTSAGTGQLARL